MALIRIEQVTKAFEGKYTLEVIEDYVCDVALDTEYQELAFELIQVSKLTYGDNISFLIEKEEVEMELPNDSTETIQAIEEYEIDDSYVLAAFDKEQEAIAHARRNYPEIDFTTKVFELYPGEES